MSPGRVEKIDGIQQRLGVGPGLVGEGPDHPGVAALLLGVAERVTAPTRRPAATSRGPSRPARRAGARWSPRCRWASSWARSNDRWRWLRVFQRSARNDQPGPAADRPEHGHQRRIDPPDAAAIVSGPVARPARRTWS